MEGPGGMSRSGAESFRHRVLRHLPALAGFFAITILYTYPLVRDFRTHVASAGDSFQFLWDFWWVKSALFQRHQSFFHTDLLFYPNGAGLAFHEFSLTNCFLSLPLQLFMSVVPIYNLLTLATFVLGAFTAYLLLVHLTGCRKSAFIAGLAFSFTSFHFNHVSRLHMASIEGLPLFVLAFLRLCERPTSWRAAQAAALYVVNSLMTWYAMVFLFLWGSVAWATAGVRLVRSVRFGLWIRLTAVFSGVALLGIGPFLWPAVRDVMAGGHSMELHQSSGFSADLAALFFLPRGHALAGAYFEPLYRKLATHVTEQEVFLGYVPVLLALVAVLRVRESRRWAVALVGFLILALGPHPQICGVEYPSVTLPWAYLSRLPFLNAMRAPTRCLQMVSLFLAILAGIGSDSLFRGLSRTRLARRSSASALTGAVGVVLAAGILLEQLRLPLAFPMTPAQAEVHPLYRMLQNEPDSAVVLDLPLPGLFYPNPMYYQTVHHKRMVGGYVARPSAAMWQGVADSPILTYLAALPGYKGRSTFGFSKDGELRTADFTKPPPDQVLPAPPFPPDELRRLLILRRIRFVVVHKVCYPPRSLARLRQLLRGTGVRRRFEDRSLLAYEIDADAGA